MRPPTANERAFLDAVLSHTFDGVEALREQWAHAKVRSSCECGCGSIGFVFDADYQPTRSTALSPVPVHAEILGADGKPAGGVAVLLRDGVLYDVDVYSHGETPLSFPPIGAVRLYA